MRCLRGALVAKLLAGAWRSPHLSPPDSTAGELDEVLELLLDSGTAPLAWWRIRESKLALAPAAERLHTAYRLQSLKAAQQEVSMGPLLQKFHARGIDPILMKGWSLASLYPEAGLRPYSDIDLIIPTGQVETALTLLADSDAPRVDLEHDQITRFDDRIWRDLYARSRLMTLGKTEARVLSPEDQLRAQCIHFLKHGGCGTLSLCDIALLVETRSPDFGWDVCLGGGRSQRSWITAALLLAHGLLGMKLEGVPLDSTWDELPSWVSRTVHEQWGRTSNAYRADLRSYLWRPAKITEAIADRWPPNPIVATLTSGACFGSWPASVLQIVDVWLRVCRWLLAGAQTVPARQGIRTECA